mgnify:CR=1 FL=1
MLVYEKIRSLPSFSATTLHTVLGVSQVMAMGYGSHLDKAKVVCKEGDIECQEKNCSFR